jgi:hypothetical protein
MVQGRRQEINRTAEQIRKALDLDQVPFPVELAVERLGGLIETVADTDAEALIKKDGDSFVIVLGNQLRDQPGDQPEMRKRFSIAHELGHLFLHMGYLVDPPRWERTGEYRDAPKYRYGFSDEETEAHEFAAALLMPADDFRAAVSRWSSDGHTQLGPLAEHFQVSREAARVRGQWLGVFEWGR